MDSPPQPEIDLGPHFFSHIRRGAEEDSQALSGQGLVPLLRVLLATDVAAVILVTGPRQKPAKLEFRGIGKLLMPRGSITFLACDPSVRRFVFLGLSVVTQAYIHCRHDDVFLQEHCDRLLNCPRRSPIPAL